MCEACNSFRDMYFFEPMIILLEALAAKTILDNTDDKRMYRAEYEVKRTQNVVREIDGVKKELSKMEWINRAEPSSEKRNHAGYIIYDDKDPKKMVYELWCDCQDFFLRNWYTFNKLDMSPWNLEPKYEKRNVLRAKAGGFLHHNKQKQKYSRTNVEQRPGCCKHLASVIYFYILGDLKPTDQEKIDKFKTLTKEPKKEIPIAPKKEIVVPSKIKEPIKVKELPKGKGISSPSKSPKGISKPTPIQSEPEKDIEEPIEAPKVKPVPIVKPIPPKPRPVEKKSLMNPRAEQLKTKPSILQTK